MRVFIHILAMTITKKRKSNHEFEGTKGGLYESVWEEEREGRNVTIICAQSY